MTKKRSFTPIKEKDIQRVILQYLNLNGHFCWKANTTGIKKANGSYIPASLRGVADIIGVSSGGYMIAVEVKRPGNTPLTNLP